MRPFHILYKLAHDIISTFSRFINALCFLGDTDQTLSSRTHVEYKRGRWSYVRMVINSIFFWQKDHCASAWEDEVQGALRTLKVNDGLKLLL